MKSRTEYTHHTELDSIFLKDYIHECQAWKWVDKIEEERMKAFRRLWWFVNYSLHINDLKIDYYGESTKAVNNQGKLKNQHPTLRFDITHLQMLYRVDLISKYAYAKFKDLEIKQFSQERQSSNKNKHLANGDRMEHDKIIYGWKSSINQQRKPFMPNRQQNNMRNIDNTYEWMERHNQIMSDYRRVDISDTADDFADEFDGIDEMKVRGIERTVNTSKKFSKPSNKIASINHIAKSSGMIGSITSTNQRFDNSYRRNELSSNFSQTSGSKRISFSKSNSDPFNNENEIVEEVIFWLKGSPSSDGFQFQAQIEDKDNIKISKNIDIGHIQTKFDFRNIQNLFKIYDIVQSIHDTLVGKGDLTSDGFWWIFSRNILTKLKMNSTNMSNTSYQTLGEENLTNEDDEHKEINIPFEASTVKPYWSKVAQKNKENMNNLSFIELYEIFI